MNRNAERIILVAVAVVTFLAMAASITFERRISNQRVMQYQLQALRGSVALFKAINGRNPKSLNELVLTQFQFPGEETKHRYLDDPPLDREGRVVDPFGMPYAYEVNKGWVHSDTKGYGYW